MTNTFTLFDIQTLIAVFQNSSIAHDSLTQFLDSFELDVYSTEDNTTVFAAGGQNDISIEFFDFDHPLKRTMSIMYWENRKPVILNY